MLKDLNVDQARFLTILAKAARAERDEFIGNVPEEDLDGVTPARGEHNPTAALGFEALPPDAPQPVTLRDAIATLSEAARVELYTLMRVGQGHLAAKKWHRGLTEARALGDDTITAALLENPDLHDHLAKGLYETKLAA
jgi:hypothetical protein